MSAFAPCVRLEPGLGPGVERKQTGCGTLVDLVSHPDYLVLVALTDHPDGRLRLFELGRVLGWEKSRLSHHVGSMAERRLVKKEKCDSDRRGAFVSITKKGRTETEAAARGHVRTVRRLFVDQLTAEQLEVIADAAEKVLAGLDGVRQAS